MKNILLLGSRGRLGAALLRRWAGHCRLTGLARPEVDLAHPGNIPALLDRHPADIVINCTGMTSLEQCEDEPGLAQTVNAESPSVLAHECSRRGNRLIHFGTDYVFDGNAPGARTEDDPASPVSVYGRSKLDGELAVASADPQHLVFRVSWVFGPDKPSFVDMILKRALEHDRVEAVADKDSSPAYTHDIAEWISPFLEGDLPGGIYHACNSGACSWRDFGQEALAVASSLGWPLRTTQVVPVTLASMTMFRAVRPRNTVMDCTKLATATGIAPRPWQEALREYLEGLPVP